MLHVVPPYAAVLAALFLVLSVRVILARRAARVPLGAGSAPALERRIWVQANFAEYVPLALLLLAMSELRGAPDPVLHGLCAALLAGRAAHAWGVSRAPEDFRFRVGGMVATLSTIALTALLLVQ